MREAESHAKPDREKHKAPPRYDEALKGLLIAIGLGALSYHIYSTRQLNPQLYEFTARNPGILVPADCETRRGIASVDYVVAQAWRDRDDPRYVEACWYPVERFKALFPIHAAKAGKDIRVEQFRKMGFQLRSFTSKAPPLWLLLASCLGTATAFMLSMMMLFGSRKQIEPSLAPDPASAIDTAKLRADLAALRNRLDDKRD